MAKTKKKPNQKLQTWINSSSSSSPSDDEYEDEDEDDEFIH